jgi:hypothetical protein
LSQGISQKIPRHNKLHNLGMQRFNLSRAHRRPRITAPTPKSRHLKPDVILSSTVRFRVLIWPECMPLRGGPVCSTTLQPV